MAEPSFFQKIIDSFNRSSGRMFESVRPLPEEYKRTPSIYATRGYTPEEFSTLGSLLSLMTNFLPKAIPRGYVPPSGIPEKVTPRSVFYKDPSTEYYAKKKAEEEAASVNRINRMFGEGE